MRMIMGLDWPTSGLVTVNGRPYGEHRRPLFEVGASLDANAIHGGRTAYNHLLALAQSNGISRRSCRSGHARWSGWGRSLTSVPAASRSG